MKIEEGVGRRSDPERDSAPLHMCLGTGCLFSFYFSKMFFFFGSLPVLMLSSSSFIASFIVFLFHTVSMCLFYLAADSL